jgi:hypothetical protein
MAAPRILLAACFSGAFIVAPRGCTNSVKSRIKAIFFWRLLFLMETVLPEAHFTATGMPSQRKHSDSLRFKRAAFYQSLKSKVGLAAAVLRINLNVAW